MEPLPPCEDYIEVELISDDVEGPRPHPYRCVREAGHDGPHSTIVTWLDNEDDPNG